MAKRAKRPIYLARHQLPQLVCVETLDFEWHPGFAVVQKQKSIKSLHDAARARKDISGSVLEISSKSPKELGKRLSAFSLCFKKEGWRPCPVECAFQGSKVFERGGPYTDLYSVAPREAKRDARLKSSGNLVRFSWAGEIWPNEPRTYFYDWLYINALDQNQNLSRQLIDYEGFTDIEFNPKRSFNCQAHSAALFVALRLSERLEDILASKDNLKSLPFYDDGDKPHQPCLI